MAGTGPQDLFALLQEFLEACEASLDTIPTFAPGLAGAPERSFVSPGQPQYDCCPDGQLTVHAAAVNSDPLQPLANQERLNTVFLVATILRCVPSTGEDGNYPEVVESQEAAEQVDADGWALWNHIFNLIRAEELFTLCGKIRWDGLRSITPSGGCGGWTLNLSVEYDGYLD
jgi:hypothetical protein